MTGQLDVPLLLAWSAVLTIGVVMVGSAVSAWEGSYLLRHGIYLLLALCAGGVLLFVPLRVWELAHPGAWLVALLLALLVLVPGVGMEANGARRWIALGPFSLQSAEAAKLLLLVYIAGSLARFDGALRDDLLALLRPLLMLAPVCVLLLLQPDFGSVVVIAATAGVLLFVAGARLRHYLVFVVLALGLFAALAVLQPYRLERLQSFLDPWSVAFGSGYQLTQALIAFGRGEIWGLGLGEGVQKLYYLPEAHNDFIFAVLAEELGLVGALALLALLGLLVLRILRTARLALAGGRPFAGYLCYGIGVLLGIQVVINVGVNTGVLPTKGLTLPFVSYGGNSLIVCCAMIGLVLRAQYEGGRDG